MEIRWKRLGYMLTFLVLMFAAIVVFAERPPDVLSNYLAGLRTVFDGRCTVPSQGLVKVECLIVVDDRRDIFVLVLFTDDIKLTHIIGVKDGKETVLWSGNI